MLSEMIEIELSVAKLTIKFIKTRDKTNFKTQSCNPNRWVYPITH